MILILMMTILMMMMMMNADDDYDDYEFLTNPGLQGATEGCKAIAWVPTSRTRTPANLMMMIMISDH